MEEAIIQVLENGPYIITGNAKLIDTQGNHLENKGQTALYRCGKSNNKPYCAEKCQKQDFKVVQDNILFIYRKPRYITGFKSKFSSN